VTRGYRSDYLEADQEARIACEVGVIECGVRGQLSSGPECDSEGPVCDRYVTFWYDQ